MNTLTRDYIETHTGKRVWLPQCEPESICIEDIAHALALQPRFAGHVKTHYSVAEHSIHVANLVGVAHKLQALLHDASEAYLCDIPTPFKRLMPEYKALEDDLSEAIARRFGFPIKLHEEVKLADRVMLMTERDHLKEFYERWHDEYEDTERCAEWAPIRMWFGLKRATPSYIEGLFLEKFEEYSLNTPLVF